MRHDAALNKKLRYLQNRIAMTEALMAFLKKHPAVASRTINWYLSNKPALCFEEKAWWQNSWQRVLRNVPKEVISLRTAVRIHTRISMGV